MKTSILTFVVASVLCSTVSFAGQVTGEKATALREALVRNGAQLERHIEIARVHVTGVRCGTALTGHGIFGTCEMLDKVSGRVIRVSDRDQRGDKRPVADLVRAMRAAGAKVEDRMGGSSIDASSIDCTVGHIRSSSISECSVRK